MSVSVSLSPAPAALPDAASDTSRAFDRAPLRFVTGTALFDGHDASIHVFRRLLQRGGAEVVHLGHNRAAGEIAAAAIEEDADAIAVSSYQGGHNEFFRYLVDLLREAGRGHVRVFGGGGGVIRPEEAAALERYGVARIYGPEDGRVNGIEGIVGDMLRDAGEARRARPRAGFEELLDGLGRAESAVRHRAAAELISLAEGAGLAAAERAALTVLAGRIPPAGSPAAPVLGITGTGGSGKSSVLDELLLRFRAERPDLGGGPLDRIGVLAVDPSKRRTGGALLGDRIRLGATGSGLFVRSLATRRSGSELATVVHDALLILRASGCGLLVVETGGIGQGDSGIVDISDVSLYVMTPEYGAESQLEKIDMLDLADAVALNKADHPGAEDALFAVRRAFRRARSLPRDAPAPVLPTVASRFADPGLDGLYAVVRDALAGVAPPMDEPTGEPASNPTEQPAGGRPDELLAGARLIPPARAGYLAEIADALRTEAQRVAAESERAGRVDHLEAALAELREAGAPEEAARALETRLREAWDGLDRESRELLDGWPEQVARYQAPRYLAPVRDRVRAFDTHRETLSGTRLPRVALPRFAGRRDTLRFLLDENLPGHYPFTAGVFPFRREEESPRRQFAGEGGPARTNRRFHLLTEEEPAKRLSVAFDSVTLYGEDPARRPDIFGKIGEGGVSVATLDDMCELFEGFRLTDPATSVSMTINGPAPAILAMFLNAALRQEAGAFEEEHGRAPSPSEREQLRAETLERLRGTVQADILKEDQAQNTCIFSTGFALRLMGDVQEFFIENRVRSFYSVSISGYHIAEAGANPITQLAFTLANGFTYVEYFLARGLAVDAFAPNLSFFFSNGLDPEYAVMARVARRIWARAMKLRYGAGERARKSKVHIQTSGRSLHAQEVQFNDIRTTLQALTATNDNCNSLHTNAYDEAITTPTPESVRRAVAIQKIIRNEFGMAWNENPLSGSFIASQLTDLVEAAVLEEFERLHARGGVLGAMERQYQRNRIQEESLLYETGKDSGEIPVIGVNTFLAEAGPEDAPPVPLARSTAEEKETQVRRTEDFQRRHAGEAPAALRRLQETARAGGNVFAELMDTVQVASLGQITAALHEVGGRYRRAM